MIALKEVLRILHTGVPCSMKVVRFDVRRSNRNGEVHEYEECVLVWGDGGSDRVKDAGSRSLTALEKELIGLEEADQRNPKHQKHFTRNVRLLLDGKPTSEIRKIRPWLIIEFNGQPTMA